MKRLAYWMRRLADRIDHQGAPKNTGLTYGYVEGQGLVVEWNGAGCPLWYLNDAQRLLAYDPRVGGVVPPMRSRPAPGR